MSSLTPQWFIKVATALFALVTLMGIAAQSFEKETQLVESFP